MPRLLQGTLKWWATKHEFYEQISIKQHRSTVLTPWWQEERDWERKFRAALDFEESKAERERETLWEESQATMQQFAVSSTQFLWWQRPQNKLTFRTVWYRMQSLTAQGWFRTTDSNTDTRLFVLISAPRTEHLIEPLQSNYVASRFVSHWFNSRYFATYMNVFVQMQITQDISV